MGFTAWCIAVPAPKRVWGLMGLFKFRVQKMIAGLRPARLESSYKKDSWVIL